MDVVQITGDGDTTSPGRAEQLLDAGGLYDPGQFTCNAYLVTGDRPVLVDTGTLAGVPAAIEGFTEELAAVVLTHQHGDHVGQLDAVLDAFDPELYAYGSHRRRTAALSDGDSVRLGEETFEVMHTPGHAPDHVVLLSERSLFAGDLVVPNDEAFAYGSFGATGGAGPARERLIESLEAVLERLPSSADHLYAGHGDPFHGDVRDLVETTLERAEQRAPKYADR